MLSDIKRVQHNISETQCKMLQNVRPAGACERSIASKIGFRYLPPEEWPTTGDLGPMIWNPRIKLHWSGPMLNRIPG